VKPFRNESILELRRSPVRAQLAGALEAFDAQPAIRVPVWIGSERREGDALVSTDPGEPERVVAEAATATEAEVDQALDTAGRAARSWGRRSAAERAEVLVAAAQWLRERRLELAALEVRECAKPWREADGDVCEAIDFLEYYARAAIALEEYPAGVPGSPALELIQPPG
jgi:acyl-CoA reductase-like NAD-dependent aldehyde dehydrogenase